ncbi:MAG: hypothetical protein PHP01_02135 [Phycisphaerae bacterium]|nr:hypothetical protein [Phycisphaerae bacterium]
MRQTPQKTVDRKRAASANIALQRKKLVVALVLLAVMGVLWLRVFVGKSTPQAATAVNSDLVKAVLSPSKTVFVELPFLPQRHNVLANDFFDARSFKEFGVDMGGSVEMPSKSDSQNSGGASAAVEAMELIAIVNDKKPQAFMEDKLLEEGRSFKFVFHDESYVFKVVKIYENKVELECNGIIVTKKIPESLLIPEQ